MERGYRLLIVAYDVSLLHVLTLVAYLKKENPRVVIHLVTNRKLDPVTSQISQFVSKVVFVRSYTGRFSKSKWVQFMNRIFFRLTFIGLSFKKYDIVNIHFAKPVLLKVMPGLAKSSKNIVITPWGSDVLRLEDNYAIRRMQIIYSYASCVTCCPETQLGIAVVEKFKYNPQKIYPLRWGIDFVDYIAETSPTKTIDESKARFGLSGRYVITCGYSNSPSHRHGAIIDAVASIREELPDNLTLLFPFTYGWASREYVQSIKDKCRSVDLDTVFIEDYLSMEDLFALRMATDMFVHIQVSDAGAACVLQYILCHKKIVHGAWMKYTDLEQFKPLFYYPVVELDNLAEVILNAYRSDGIDIPDGVIHAIMERSWSKEIKKWDSLFRSMAH